MKALGKLRDRGLTIGREKIKASPEYKEWRNSVFVRDNFTCQECGRRGYKLHAHHIKPFSSYLELRFDINNGLTLCKECHHKTDNYGKNIPKGELQCSRK